MFKFQTLIVWQKAIELADKLVKIADGLPQKYQYSFADQLRRAALSIPSNIAEGNGRRTQKDTNNFYHISLGSTFECINILILLSKRKIWIPTENERQEIYNLSTEVCKIFSSLIK